MLNLLNLNLFLNVRCLSLVNPKLSFTTSKNECSILFGVYNNKIFFAKVVKVPKENYFEFDGNFFDYFSSNFI